jgi:hypothetical protein
VTGKTDSTSFPVKNALQPKYGGGQSDAFGYAITGQTRETDWESSK